MSARHKLIQMALGIVGISLGLSATAKTNTGTRLDVNDVAYLWPVLPEKDFNELLIPIVDDEKTGATPSLFGKGRALFDDLIKFSAGKSFLKATEFKLPNSFTGKLEEVTIPTDSWQNEPIEQARVVAFRVDDCGDAFHDGSKQNQGMLERYAPNSARQIELRRELLPCETMLRLVAVTPFQDNAMHLIYAYRDQGTLENLYRDLIALKKKSPIPTDGVPLSVHPGLENEAHRWAFTEHVNKFIAKYARKENLKTVAVLSTNEFDGGDQWNFFEAEISHHNGRMHSTMRPLHPLINNPISQGFHVNEVRGSKAARGRSILSAVAGEFPIENVSYFLDPRKAFPTNTDCKSCHSGTKAALELLRADRAGFDRLFMSPDDFYYEAGVTSFPDPRHLPRDPANFRAFGWFRETVTINIHVAKKAGAVAASLNRRFLGSPRGPGRDCSVKHQLALKCFVENKNADSCLQTYCE